MSYSYKVRAVQIDSELSDSYLLAQKYISFWSLWEIELRLGNAWGMFSSIMSQWNVNNCMNCCIGMYLMDS